MVILQWVESGNHKQGLNPSRFPQGAIDIQRHAVTGLDGLSVPAQNFPLVGVFLKAIGHAKRFERGDKTHHGKLGQQEEVKLAGRAHFHGLTPVAKRAQRACQRGGRFSENARGPSAASSERSMAR